MGRREKIGRGRKSERNGIQLPGRKTGEATRRKKRWSGGSLVIACGTIIFFFLFLSFFSFSIPSFGGFLPYLSIFCSLCFALIFGFSGLRYQGQPVLFTMITLTPNPCLPFAFQKVANLMVAGLGARGKERNRLAVFDSNDGRLNRDACFW